MRLKEIRPMIRTKQLRATVDFYVNQLGFTCREYDETWGWAAFHRDHIEMMAASAIESQPFDKPEFTGSFYILVDENIETLWEEFKTKAKVCYPIEDFDYGMREFAIYDNNGYLLQFGMNID